jgi:putative ABC transport system substrate-binding protein
LDVEYFGLSRELDMRRRELITPPGATAAAWPPAARAQQGERMRRIGLLPPAAADDLEFQAAIGAGSSATLVLRPA